MVGAVAVLAQQPPRVFEVEQVAALRLGEQVVDPVEHGPGQPLPVRGGEAHLGPFHDRRGHELLDRAAQRHLGLRPDEPVLDRDPRGGLPHAPVEERDAHLQAVGHGHPVGLDEDVATHPGVQVEVLHPGRGVEMRRFGPDAGGDLADVRGGVAQQRVLGFTGEDLGVADEPLFEFGGATFEEALALHPVGQCAGGAAQQVLGGVGQRGDRPQRMRLPVDGVPAEQLVGAFAAERDGDVLGGLFGHEVERDQ